MVRPKILIASSVHVWNDNRVYYKEALTLAGICDVRLVAVHNDIAETVAPGNMQIEQLPPVKSGTHPWDTVIIRLKRIGKILTEVMKKDYDVFHFHDPELMPVGWVAKLLGKKVIYDVHEDNLVSFRSKKWLPAPVRGLLGWIVRLLELMSLPVFDRLLLAERCYQDTFHTSRCRLVQNYPLKRDPPDLVRRSEDQPLKLIYIGALSMARGITDLVEAAAQVRSESRNITLDIFGQIGEKELVHRVRSPEFSGWLNYHGWVPVAELSQCLPEFHVGINPVRDYPNYRYSLLTKIFDYIAAGLPVITTDLPGIMGEFGEDGFMASYSSGDVAGLAAAIRAFIDEDRRATMAKKALEVSRRYSWDSQAQVLLEIYREILA